MKIVASSLSETIIVAEKVNEDFGKTLVNLWNEFMYWNHKKEYHFFLANEDYEIK